MTRIHIWPEEISEKDETIYTGFVLEDINGDRNTVWYRIPAEFSSTITRSSDPYVVASLFKAMSTPADMAVHGEVSPSLLFNLEEFQAAWTSWKPRQYSRVDIIADKEQERSQPAKSNAVTLFSGGVDSCFTAWRYRKENGEKSPFFLQAGLFIHGIDIPWKLENSFNEASTKAKNLMDSLGMQLIPMATNQRIIHRPMTDSQAAFMSSCLMLLQEAFIWGLIPGSDSYKHLYFPYGTNPITDPLLSSKSFSITYDGAKYSRLDKISQISSWPEGIKNLRVCMGRYAEDRSHNCCRCEKCIRTILEFRVLGLGLPPCFEQDVTDSQIRRLKYLSEEGMVFYDEILAMAKSRKISDSWVQAIHYSYSRNQLRLKAEKYPLYININNGLRKVKRLIRNQ